MTAELRFDIPAGTQPTAAAAIRRRCLKASEIVGREVRTDDEAKRILILAGARKPPTIRHQRPRTTLVDQAAQALGGTLKDLAEAIGISYNALIDARNGRASNSQSTRMLLAMIACNERSARRLVKQAREWLEASEK